MLGLLICSSGCHESVVRPSTAAQLNAPSGFDLAAAMTTLFGNFDPATQTSISDVPQTMGFNLSGSLFEVGDEIKIRPFWLSPVVEAGTSKMVLLTYAVPLNLQPLLQGEEPFTCHACAPLIGAAVFTMTGGKWEHESFAVVVARAGAWGQPPKSIRVINIGPQRIGIEITDTGTGQGETTMAKRLFVPWAGKVNEALMTIVSDDNKGNCGTDLPPCYANRKRLEFVAGKNADYYDIIMTLSGTDMADSRQYGVKRVHGVERFKFTEEKYKRILGRAMLPRLNASLRIEAQVLSRVPRSSAARAG